VWKDWNDQQRRRRTNGGPTSPVDHDVYAPGPLAASFRPTEAGTAPSQD
jgi:hypothetical protein